MKPWSDWLSHLSSPYQLTSSLKGFFSPSQSWLEVRTHWTTHIVGPLAVGFSDSFPYIPYYSQHRFIDKSSPQVECQSEVRTIEARSKVGYRDLPGGKEDFWGSLGERLQKTQAWVSSPLCGLPSWLGWWMPFSAEPRKECNLNNQREKGGLCKKLQIWQNNMGSFQESQWFNIQISN